MQLRVSRESSFLVSHMILQPLTVTDFKTESSFSSINSQEIYPRQQLKSCFLTFQSYFYSISNSILRQFNKNNYSDFVCLCVYINMYYKKNTIIRLIVASSCDVSHVCISFNSAKFFLVPQPPEKKIISLLKKLKPPGFIQHISTMLLETGFLYHISKPKEIP